MRWEYTIKTVCVLSFAGGLLAPAATAPFSGSRALEYTAHMVAFGERPSGSGANAKTAEYIEQQLRALPCRLSEDTFTAQTPEGAVAMRNIIADFGDPGARLIVLTGHFDTKRLPRFVGANDGGSSAGWLLEMAHAVAGRKWKHQIRLVWFDGEEAVHNEWTEQDSVYGSRHLAERWDRDGTLRRIDALINVDMIGDKDLGIVQEQYSSPKLNTLVWQVAAEMHHADAFENASGGIDDDHMPFRRRGVNAMDIIDFDFGPNNSYWHTPQDTMDKLSARSLQVVGDVILEVLRRLE